MPPLGVGGGQLMASLGSHQDSLWEETAQWRNKGDSGWRGGGTVSAPSEAELQGGFQDSQGHTEAGSRRERPGL